MVFAVVHLNKPGKHHFFSGLISMIWGIGHWSFQHVKPKVHQTPFHGNHEPKVLGSNALLPNKVPPMSCAKISWEGVVKALLNFFKKNHITSNAVKPQSRWHTLGWELEFGQWMPVLATASRDSWLFQRGLGPKKLQADNYLKFVQWLFHVVSQ